MATAIAAPTETTNVPALTPEGEKFALRQRQARMFAMSPLVPEHLRKGPPEQAIANCWIALTLAEAMGEVPLIVMQNIHVVNGKAGFASQYMIARANSSGVFKGRIDWRVDNSDPNNLSVTAFAVIKDSGQEVSVTCDMKMAKAEGWTKNAKYSTMPEVMLRYRSAAFLVRFYAPDVMLGYQTSEELEDVIEAAKPSQPPLSARMLVDQAKPIETTAEAVDTDTGEIAEDNSTEASGTAREAPGAAESAVATSDEVNASTDGPAANEEDATPPQAQPEQQSGFSLGEQIGIDEPQPQEKTAAEEAVEKVIASADAARTPAALEKIIAAAEEHKQFMPNDLAVKLEIAFDRNRNRLQPAEQTELAK